MPSSKVDENIREKFRRSGYTLTAQRRAVLDALRQADGHPSAEEVYLIVKRKNPRIALGTVYQALSVLEEIGVISSKHWAESPIRYDLNLEPHLDIRCIRCGRVSEVPGIEMGDLKARVQENTPYEVTSADLVLEGICPECRKTGES
ncbi:MAG: transcriptional repressor [Rubrobacteraceae bacterium]|uniref:Fur family transcriptional regulator n=1 Tax=Rubrobacter naiadicus TaxID=1392641 RepID=UPI0023624623|nr:transcriptional repressor [Rubrobacter naiadicus]MCL6439150.1 transcriptional repressor [Rubrobacteraceae bacterium]